MKQELKENKTEKKTKRRKEKFVPYRPMGRGHDAIQGFVHWWQGRRGVERDVKDLKSRRGFFAPKGLEKKILINLLILIWIIFKILFFN